MMWDHLFINANLATMAPRSEVDSALGIIRGGALAIAGDRIAWVGPGSALPAPAEKLARQVEDLAGAWILPGLIDCHTHLVFAGNRAREFELRLKGAGYEEIARTGGGIRATVEATRRASEEELVAASLPRLDALRAEGVTTVEIKSGYGLELDSECRMLRAAGKLGELRPVRIRRTFLGAHALPPDDGVDRHAYITQVCEEMIPVVAAAGLADAVDAFLERIAFAPAEVARVLAAARAHGLAVHLHADQLSDGGGAALAARYHALSADHLEHADAAGIAAMAEVGTVAVLLPGAYYFLGENQKPPLAAMRRTGVTIALASDCNPGSSPLLSPLIVLNMGCCLFGLSVEEALSGMTIHAAQALGLAAEIGTLEVGKAADLSIWSIAEPVELCYWIGLSPLRASWHAGRRAWPGAE
ncbi:MAG: imidazolonepropionase [Alphaproteobacteria bacterium]|nr:MAG: imidazolonepropionase [Alphaproteobacteria bacterium]